MLVMNKHPFNFISHLLQCVCVCEFMNLCFLVMYLENLVIDMISSPIHHFCNHLTESL